MAKLTEAQIESVSAWAEQGASLNDVQQRLKSELGISITYLEARMLLLDIGVKIKEKPKPEPTPEAVVVEPPPSVDDWTAPDSAAPLEGRVTVNVDSVALEGTIASGKATFSDGQIVVWYVDPNGRLGMKAPYAGYQPPAQDIPMFERELDRLLQGL